tara:strand:+ start:407 stop:613 length:207 start_codon:yes stop_codon:yes gene_type:complete
MDREEFDRYINKALASMNVYETVADNPEKWDALYERLKEFPPEWVERVAMEGAIDINKDDPKDNFGLN